MPAQRMTEIPYSGIREIFSECNRLERNGEDIVHLEIGRPDFDTPSPIKQAAKSAIDEGHVHYTSNYGIQPLRDRISAKFETDSGISYDPEDEIIVTAGASEAVFVSIMSMVDPGTEVLIPDPCWTYAPTVRAAGGTPVRYPLDPESGFQPNIEALDSLINDDTSLLILNSPHNPTGSVIDDDHLRAVRDLVVENDLIAVSDEIYEKIIYGGAKHRSLASLDGMYERTITINGVSKAYSMTGWRVGYLGAPKELADEILRMRQYTTTCAPSISQYAALRALEGDLFEPLVEAFADRRALVCERIEDVPGMTAPTPEGAIYVYPTVPEPSTDGREFVWSLLHDTGVALVPGDVFGSNSSRVRIAYSNSLDRINTAFDRIEAWVENQ
ncbi:pyridoxal phosphate-dependent aminotransferase [Haloferax sp. ATB1]|uniref:pyridoxal phosphate-dependent aminotransferase n=1 Tax=Haloferax sp. ATB1 TaxID=1508454 RepID=UPI0005B219BC|nr:pyridoxal phosphate-dependent aminotransferase [Haloferax sp. ATB1]